MTVTEKVKNFYNRHPCGTDFINSNNNYDKKFFETYDEFRYKQIPSILEIMESIELKGKKVLEIGTGLGADAQKIIERGGLYYGIDLTPASIEILKKRFETFGLTYQSLTEMNAEDMTFPDEFFDVIYSCGVLLTSPNIEKIVINIHRLLKKKGKAVIMLYHKNSLNYYIFISIIRRIGIFLLYIPYMDKIVSKLTGENIERLNKHKRNLRQYGLTYLKMKNFIHRSTDGPDHPYSSVWTKKMCDKLFSRFSEVKYKIRCINKRHFPFLFRFVPDRFERYIEKKWGWNLWIDVLK